MSCENSRARPVEHKFFNPLELRDPLKLAPAAGHSIDVLRVGGLRTAQYIEPTTIGGQDRIGYLESALRQRLCAALQRLRVQMRKTALLGLEPERAVVVEPAKFVESPVYPCRIAQSMLRNERVLAEIHAGDPSILVVDRHELDGKCGAIAAPRKSAGAGLRFIRHQHHPALRRLRILGVGRISRRVSFTVLLTNLLQGVIANAR